MNEIIDLSKDAIKNEGNLWINKKSGQLRYSLSKSSPSKWIVPLSEYKVGNNGNMASTYIKCGQPVSIGLIDDLLPENKVSADPYIVPTNPAKYQWCIGLALEPGNATLDVNGESIFNTIHILSHGQIEFNLSDTRDNIFQPPSENGKYLWTYEDIGKPVYVSNHPDDNNGSIGGLTIDITHAYFNGANIVSVGRIADAPTASQVEQIITLEIQLAGDIRGMVDSTQFAVSLDKDQDKKTYNTTYDKLLFVKIRNKGDEPKGYIIYDDAIMIGTSSNTPIGCFLAKPKNGKINTADWVTDGKAVLVHRLGIVTGNFNYPESDYGKELFLSGGEAVTAGPAGSYEYKVGLVIDKNHILVDCRFPRILKKFDAVGTIKPAYMEADTINPPGKIIVDPGFLAIIENEVHKVTDYIALMQATMYTGIYEFSDDGISNWYEIDASKHYTDIEAGYFRFRDLIYQTSDGKVISQIKFNQEGAPDDMQYLWPELVFDHIFEINADPQTYFGSNIKFNIDYLVNLGTYSDEVIKNIEFYDIILKIPHAVNATQQGLTIEGDITVSPGFYTVIDENGEQKWAGFEWAIGKEGNSWFLYMITKPGALSMGDPGFISATDVWGFCWPVGIKLQKNIIAKIYIRRRPIQHHALFLNQLLKDFPWAPFTDGRDLITEDTIHFGKHRVSGDIYSTEYHPRIEIKQDGPISGILNPLDPQYYISHNIYYSPYFVNNQDIRHTIDQVIERRIPERVPSSDTKNYDTIEWIYNFRNKKVSLNADFAAHLNFPSTAIDKINSSGEIIHTIDFSGDYIQDRTIDNISGVYVTPRSALKTLHEIPVGFAEYYNVSGDTEANGLKIVTAQEQWNSGDTVERYLPNDVVRQIYDPVSGVYVPGTSYTYNKNDNTNDFLAEEWDHIKQEINLVFNPIKRIADNDHNDFVAGGDYQVIQSNVSLLNYAAKETQDRLLKIERAIFGIDAPTLPGNQEIDTYVRNKLYSYSESLNDMGIIRIIKELFNNNILEDTLYDNGEVAGTISYFNDVYLELFGNYENEDEFNNISGNQLGKFHSVYFFFKNFNASVNEIDNSFLSETTWLSKRVIYENNIFKLSLPYFKNEDKKGIVKEESIIPGGNNLFYHEEIGDGIINGEYTAFGFINEKLSTAWSNKISPIYLPNNLSNSGNLDKSHFKFISSSNDISDNLNNLNKWGIYKNQLDVNDEYFDDILPDNVIQYRFNSSGLAFNISGANGEAENINTKFVAELKNENEVGISGNLHRYVITDLGNFIFDVEYTKSSFDKSKITFNNGTLPSMTRNGLTGTGFIHSDNYRYTFSQGTLPSITIQDSVYTPETINLISGHIWMIDDYSISSDGAGFKFKRSFTRTNPNNGNLSGIAYRPYINGFKLYGAHIPERYDMLTKIRAENHIVDQIHLILQDGPFNYPKELKDIKVEAKYELYIDDMCVVYWKPLSVANNYVVFVKYQELNPLNGQIVTYWRKIGFTNTNAIVFKFLYVDTELKILLNIVDFGDESTISTNLMSFMNDFVICDININDDTSFTSDKTMLEANPDFAYFV
jgi:hypothetical protein